MDRAAALLRRYVINRSAGVFPHPEYAKFDAIHGVGAWIKCGRREARESGRWKRLRIEGRPWCPILGSRVAVAHDVELQAFFSTVRDGDWFPLERAVRQRPSLCLAEWREAGRRLISVVQSSALGTAEPGKLAGWPKGRGKGHRTPIGGRKGRR